MRTWALLVISSTISYSIISIFYFQLNFWTSFLMIFYSLSVYALTSAWYNLKTYLMEHHIYVFGYVVIVGLISFAVTYRMVRLITADGW